MGIVASCIPCLLCDDSDEELSYDENPSTTADENPSITADENIPTITEDDERFVQEQLLDREMTSFANTHHTSLQIPDAEWARKARTYAVDGILRTRESLGLQHSIAYVTVTYVDRILARVEFDRPGVRAQELLPKVCFSLACKMESTMARLRFQEDSYTMKRMEIWVLFTLEWRMGTVTPFDFVHCFASIFSREHSPAISISTTSDVILAAVRDKDLIRNRPSVIAAAATLVRLDPRLNREALEPILNASSVSQSLNIEQVWSCYNQFKQLLGIPDSVQNRNDGEASSSRAAAGSDKSSDEN